VKAPHFGWFVLCERASFDGDTNALTLTDCVERVRAEDFPAIMHRMCAVAYFYRDDASKPWAYEVRVVVEPPGRPEVIVIAGNVRFDAGHLRVRSRFTFDLFTFLTPGVYFFRLDLPDGEAWRAAARLPVTVETATSSLVEPLPEPVATKGPTRKPRRPRKVIED
jgi:hypothetical protein